MKKSTFILTFFILIVIISIPVSAKINGNYLYFSIGAWQLADEIQIPGVNNSWTLQTDTNTGLYLNCGSGYYDIWSCFRLEFDISYRTIPIADVEIIDMNVVGISIQGGEGNVTSISFMLNGWYDLDITKNWGFYLGGGLGAGRISLKEFYIETAPVVPNPKVTKTLYINDSDWRFAMQAGAGFTYILSDNLMLDLGFRYYRTSDPKFITEMGDEFFANMQSHSAFLSLKFTY